MGGGPGRRAAGAGRAGEGLWHYWDVRGSRGEGLRWLTAALATVGPDRPERMTLLSAAALLHLGRAEFAATEALAAELRTLAVRAGDHRWEGDALALRATVAWARGSFDRAQQLLRGRRRRLARRAATCGARRWRRPSWPGCIATGASPTPPARSPSARTLHADAVGEELARGLARDVAASIEHRWGNPAAAKRLVSEALTHYRLVGYREGEASALHLAGRIALADGDRRRAARQLGRSLSCTDASVTAPGSAGTGQPGRAGRRRHHVGSPGGASRGRIWPPSHEDR